MGLKQEILDLNKQRSREFCDPASVAMRELYRNQHPTNVLTFVCMDGRVNIPLITGTPFGVLHSYRNIGGKFTLGDPYLGRLVLDSFTDAMREGRRTLVLCTYHYSEGDTHRGCAGHKYDTASALQGARRLKREFERSFGPSNPVISAIVVGIETDKDALVFHNGNGQEFKIADHLETGDRAIRNGLQAIYPDLDNQLIDDLLPLALGNQDRVRTVREQGRPTAELVHGENVICIGRGFDWLHLPNRALIIGPYGHTDGTWRGAIEVAGKIVLGNFAQNPALGSGGALLLVSAPYTDLIELGLAIAKVNNLATIAKRVLTPMASDLKLGTLFGITDMKTMEFSEIEAEELV